MPQAEEIRRRELRHSSSSSSSAAHHRLPSSSSSPYFLPLIHLPVSQRLLIFKTTYHHTNFASLVPYLAYPYLSLSAPVNMAGFDFSNYNRNAALHAKGVPLPKATSTGTTIVGCIFDNGVVVGDDGIYRIMLVMMDCPEAHSILPS